MGGSSVLRPPVPLTLNVQVYFLYSFPEVTFFSKTFRRSAKMASQRKTTIGEIGMLVYPLADPPSAALHDRHVLCSPLEVFLALQLSSSKFPTTFSPLAPLARSENPASTAHTTTLLPTSPPLT